MTGAELIAAERQRQIDVEGWTPEHDREHGRGELAQAAAAYAVPAHASYLWPWRFAGFKRAGRVRELVKAGALIAAEIDRLHGGPTDEPTTDDEPLCPKDHHTFDEHYEIGFRDGMAESEAIADEEQSQWIEPPPRMPLLAGIDNDPDNCRPGPTPDERPAKDKR